MYYIYNILLSIVLAVGVLNSSFAQNQPNLLDQRTCNKSCPSNNYDVQGFYLSDINGTPITNSLLTCTPGVEQIVYITLRYQANSSSAVSNARFFADFQVGEEKEYLNYFFGPLSPDTSGTGTLTLSSFPVNWTCGLEVSFLDPLLVWTTSSSSDLSQDYVCNDYPAGQCQYQGDLVVDAPLAVQFDYSYTCPTTDVTNVSFTNTTNGGRGPYQFSWTFTNATLESSNSENPILDFNGPGTATLQATDVNGTVNTYQAEIDIPTSFEHVSVINNQTNTDSPDGSIDLETNHSGNLTYSWTGPNGFSSVEKNIFGLSEGQYQVIITDEYSCSEQLDFEIAFFIVLPLLNDNLNAKLKKGREAVDLKWVSAVDARSSHFEVERAINDVSKFSTVGILPITVGSSNLSSYIFTDRALPKSHCRIYYRIKLVSEFGKSIYGTTKMVEIPESNPEKKWIAFPNPFEWNNLQLKYMGDPQLLKGLIHIRVYSPIYAFSNQLSTKNSLIDLGKVIKSAPNGLLIIEIEYLDKVEIVKVMKK